MSRPFHIAYILHLNRPSSAPSSSSSVCLICTSFSPPTSPTNSHAILNKKAVFILLNILIAILYSTYSEIVKAGRRIWILEMADIVAEIEQYHMLSTERDRVEWFGGALVYWGT